MSDSSVTDEWYGEPAQILAQQTLSREHRWLASQENLLSQGRRLLIFDAHMLPIRQIEDLVRRFGSVLIHGKSSHIPALSVNLQTSGFGVYRDLMLFEGDIVDLLPRIRSVQQNSSWPPGWSLTWVDRETKREDITNRSHRPRLRPPIAPAPDAPSLAAACASRSTRFDSCPTRERAADPAR